MYRTVSGIAKLISSLLLQFGQALSLTRIQNITLPPHHRDKPGDQPNCKGFALVTLADEQDVQTLLEEWPWGRKPELHDKSSSTTDDYARESSKFGLRTLSKSRWDQLKDEYLAYQQKLLDELVAFNEGPVDHRLSNDIHFPEHDEEQETTYQPEPEPKSADAAVTTFASSYPLNCLVFVRNIHPETNKTTLRKLFSAAFGATSAENLDYVDFNKGMDSVRWRLTFAHLGLADRTMNSVTFAWLHPTTHNY